MPSARASTPSHFLLSHLLNGQGAGCEKGDLLHSLFSCAAFTEQRNSSRGSVVRKAFHLQWEQKDGDKDACCRAFPLIKIDFLLLSPTGSHQVNGSERLRVQSCCSYIALPFFAISNQVPSMTSLSMSTLLPSRKFPTESRGGDGKKDDEERETRGAREPQ